MLKHYPRLTTIALSYVAAGLLFVFLGASFFQTLLVPLGMFGVFIAGALYTYSFTTSLGALLLITLAPFHPLGLIAVIAGIGATIADFAIFQFVRDDLHKEVKRVAASKIIRNICAADGLLCKKWMRNAMGTLIMASPFPDELGIAMMSTTKMRKETFILLAFIVDVVGIYILVSAAGVVV
jgi:hypothetical protein